MAGMDWGTIMSIVGPLAFQHPSLMTAFSQLQTLEAKHSADIEAVKSEYFQAMTQSTGPMDQAGIVLELMKKHPALEPALSLVIGLIMSHGAELQQVLAEVQAKVNALPEDDQRQHIGSGTSTALRSHARNTKPQSNLK